MNPTLYTALVHLHSFGRWLVLILLLVAVFRHATAGDRPFNAADRRVGLLNMIFSDTMLLIGLVLWVFGPRGYQLIATNGMAEVMKNSVYRFFAVEHQVGMLIALVLVHIAKAQGKKNLADRPKHRRSFIFYLLALLIILISIPWPFRAVGEGRGWF